MSEHEDRTEADVTDLVVLIDEEGAEHRFIIVEVVEVDEEKYAVLVPAEDDDEGAVILRFALDDEGNDILVGIEDEEEWEMVAKAVEEILE